MSRTVWKFPIVRTITIEVPRMAAIRLAGIDPATGDPAIWIELDPEAPRVPRRFDIFGTGDSIEGDGGFPFPLHVGSIIQGAFVWHIYEIRT